MSMSMSMSMSKSEELAQTKRLRQSTNNLPFTSHFSREANGFPL
jgi:hypothetical protein